MSPDLVTAGFARFKNSAIVPTALTGGSALMPDVVTKSSRNE